MERSELIGIGKLGFPEPGGYYHVQCNQADRDLLNQIQECFLIFDSNRVFFVTVEDRKTVANRFYLKFAEDGIKEESRRAKDIVVAVGNDQSELFSAADETEYLFGYDVYYQDDLFGKVEDAILSPMQAVLVIRLNDDRELLVPRVSYYVSGIDRKSKAVYTQNLESLLAVCTST
jgi:ribosomal 30S subunit maturation factor RimM